MCNVGRSYFRPVVVVLVCFRLCIRWFVLGFVRRRIGWQCKEVASAAHQSSLRGCLETSWGARAVHLEANEIRITVELMASRVVAVAAAQTPAGGQLVGNQRLPELPT